MIDDHPQRVVVRGSPALGQVIGAA